MYHPQSATKPVPTVGDRTSSMTSKSTGWQFIPLGTQTSVAFVELESLLPKNWVCCSDRKITLISQKHHFGGK